MKRILFFAALFLSVGMTTSAQMIGATNNQQTPRTQRVNDSPVFRPTGGSLRFSTGVPGLFTVSYNHYISSSFMIGGGTGVGFCAYSYTRHSSYGSYQVEGTDIAAPIFAEVDIRTPKYKWSLFLNLKSGFHIFSGRDDNEPFFAAAAVGISYKNLNLGVGISTIMTNDGWPDFFVSYNLPISTIEKWLFK